MQAVINNFVLCFRLLDLRHKINYVDTLNNYVVCRRTYVHIYIIRFVYTYVYVIKASKAFLSYRTTKVHFCLIFSLTVTKTSQYKYVNKYVYVYNERMCKLWTVNCILQTANCNNNKCLGGTLRDLVLARDVTQRLRIELYALHAYDLNSTTPTTAPHTYVYQKPPLFCGWGYVIATAATVAQFAKAS